jgi:hypothetical protein
LFALVVSPFSAQATTFEELAKTAIPIARRAELATLFWSATVDCESIANDLDRRQCDGLKRARGEFLAGQTFLAVGDPSALSVGDWDAARSSLPVVVRGCLACAAPLELDGASLFLTTVGQVGTEEGHAVGPEVQRSLRRFPSEDAATTWKAEIAARLRTELVFRLAAPTEAWESGALKGFAVEVVAFRVLDPCDGQVVMANPPSGNEKPARAACVEGGAPPPAENEAPVAQPTTQPSQVEESLPETLASSQISRVLQTTRSHIEGCYATYGVPGKSKLSIYLGGNGLVDRVTLVGDFEDTPTGQCIMEAVKQTQFPKFKKSSMIIRDYPIQLR